MMKKWLNALLALLVPSIAVAVPLAPYGGNQVDVTTVGMKANSGFDNSVQLNALLLANGTAITGGGTGAWFPSVQSDFSVYYFSQFIPWSRYGGKIQCGGAGKNTGTILLFAPGVNGIVQESTNGSPDGSGTSMTETDGCAIFSLGYGEATDTNGSNILTSARFLTGLSAYGAPTPVWQAGDGFLAIPFFNMNNQPSCSTATVCSSTSLMAVPPGTVVTLATGSAGSQTLTVSSNVSDTQGRAATFQLPAALTYSVTTTAGSPTITLTAGPAYKFQSGDLIWSDAFPFGAAIWSITGSSYPYTVQVADFGFSSGTINASVTHAAGSGKMWLVPSGLSRKTSGKASNNSLRYWPVGINVICSSSPVGTEESCTGSKDESNVVTTDILGIVYSGADSGASTMINNIGADNYLADFVEGGTVGSMHIGNNSNCEEGQRCPHGVVGNCTGFNNSVYIGEYDAAFAKWQRYCISALAGFGATTGQIDISIPTGLGGGAEFPLFISPQAGIPVDIQNIGHGGGSSQTKYFYGQWAFGGGNLESGQPQGYFSANANSGGTTTISVGSLPCFASLGYAIADATTPAAIPGGTTITAFSGSCGFARTITTSAATNVLSGDQLYLTTSAPCIKVQGGYSDQYDWQLREACGENSFHSWVFDGQRYSFNLNNNGGTEMILEGVYAQQDYYGDGRGYVFFPRGFKIASNDLFGTLGGERVFDFGSAAPTWTSGAGNKQGNIRMNVGAGPGQAAGWYDTANGLNFMPFGLIANDAAGASYIIGAPVAIGSLPPCVGTSGARATVNNGLPSPTYHQAVSAIGSPPTVQPVACAGGTGWVYD